VGPFGFGNGAFDGHVIDLFVVVSSLPLVLKYVLVPPMMVRIVPWVGKLSFCCGGLWICSRGRMVGWFLIYFVELCCLAFGRSFVELVEDMLFMELAKARGGWLWHNDKIDNKPEHVPSCCFGGFVVKKAKGGMWNISGEAVPIALCDLLL
jgi:hypothetical protein